MSAHEIDVRYAAQLSRLNLSDEEIEKFQSQLAQVIANVDQLTEVDVTGVEPTAHTNPVFNVLRDDEARPGLTNAEALANAPQQANGLFMVTKVME